MTDRITISESILDLYTLNKTDFERYPTLLQWVNNWIGVNIIQPLTPDVWFEEGNVIRGGVKNRDGIWISHHSKGIFLWMPATAVADTLSRQLGCLLMSGLKVCMFLSVTR